MKSSDFDVVVIGSGPSGANAARAAVSRGVSVCMVDVGHSDSHYAPLIPDMPFTQIRATDPEQRRYFLGDENEGIPEGDVRVGAQLTPPRQFITQDTEKYQSIESDTFFPMQSLALGGLGAGWGAGAVTYEDHELFRMGLPVSELRRYYHEVSQDIGISGSPNDDVSDLIADGLELQPPLPIDTNAETIRASYRRKRIRLLASGFRMGHIPLAVLSQDKGDRRANPLFDMDFYGASRESVYRPAYTVRELKRYPNFQYRGGTLAQRFTSADGVVTLHCLGVGGDESSIITCRRLLLGAGAINTARLVLRSLSAYDVRVPLLCNPYSYIPAVNMRMLGRPGRDERYSLAQLTAIIAPDEAPEDRISAQFFSYRSLLMFKLVKEMPLPPGLGLLAARALATSLTIVGVHLPDTRSESRWLQLSQEANGEVFRAHYERSTEELSRDRRAERLLMKYLIALGCIPFRIIHPGNASSIHYAGTIPFSDRNEALTCDANGEIRGAPGVHVADGSTFRYLPAKGLTLTLMANARRIADLVCNELTDPLPMGTRA